MHSDPVSTFAANSLESVSGSLPQVRLKSERSRLLLVLPEPDSGSGQESRPEGLTWEEVLQQLEQRLKGGERFWQPESLVYLRAGDRLLDLRQLQDVAAGLECYRLRLRWVETRRKSTALAAINAGYSVEQLGPHDHLSGPKTEDSLAQAEPLYLQMTVRSGVEIRHPGTVVILGDVNPGGEVVADGDILVWGRLRGLAHAGAAGNFHSVILALQMAPTLLRISDRLARVPEGASGEYQPEVAYIAGGPTGSIHIAHAADFVRQELPRLERENPATRLSGPPTLAALWSALDRMDTGRPGLTG
ncbi:septum site-determining protein MinC [Leptolyngbya sp. FACHB-261]|uniref:septum site-determining protein MinC n=1 Tax=Leptolyngbya sp. FACHB-261 TaxID=2692806 RepID=UPI00168A1D9B|nr:septum site-determining protein MinC [Leptolyngbya sp. FACHB-261]MBD2099658.1 septum site-determining protein MinC [Leptolyngbya sp. FACHB-261]